MMNVVVLTAEDVRVVKEALIFYGELKYSHRMGLPSEVQFIAEEALARIEHAEAIGMVCLKEG